MKAISLWQPWASFMADGWKRIETRSWRTSYRGPIAIHAAKRWQSEQQDILNHLIAHHAELEEYASRELPFGCIVAVMHLTAIHRTEDIRDSLTPLERALGDYSDGRFAWEMELIEVPREPIPATGAQGIWDWIPKGGNGAEALQAL